MFIIEDDFHAESFSEQFSTFDSALSELRRISNIPFGTKPNIPPCTDWQHCLREYHILEYNNSQIPWILLSDTKALAISEAEVNWFFE